MNFHSPLTAPLAVIIAFLSELMSCQVFRERDDTDSSAEQRAVRWHAKRNSAGLAHERGCYENPAASIQLLGTAFVRQRYLTIAHESANSRESFSRN